MTSRELLDDILNNLPDDQIRKVLEYAEFLGWQDENEAWRRFGLQQLARAYGDDEPEYTLDDIIDLRVER